nr:MAG: DBP protein [unidentified adenovirus]
MSTNNYEALSSSGEEELVIDETPRKPAPLPRKKRPLKRKHVMMVAESEDEAGPDDSSDAPHPPLPSLPPKKKAKVASGPSEEQKWQEVTEAAMKFMVPLKVDTKGLTMLFDSPTFECFRKACQAWLNEKKVMPSLTYSTHKSFVSMMARFVFDFLVKSCDLIPKSNVNLTGAAIWEHGCLAEGGALKCLHGTPMIQKEQIIEMEVSSENAQRALKEQPQKAKVTTNRWGRNVVQLKNDDAAACVNDANSPNGSFSSKSCGMFFTESSKALVAFRQIMEYQKACYPKMPSAGSRLLMPVKCECNYINPMPLLGRQTCKITPFSLSSASGLDAGSISDPTFLASVNHPAVLVFQCCNPVYRGSRANTQKNCDFKLSAPDAMSALQLAKQFWNSYFEKPAPLTIPEFKWQASLQYQNSILPTPFEDRDDALF